MKKPAVNERACEKCGAEALEADFLCGRWVDLCEECSTKLAEERGWGVDCERYIYSDL